MNLPELSQLRNDASTYIAFQRTLNDYDKSIATNKEWYFSKLIAIKLPVWAVGDMFIDLSSVGVPVDASPNLVFPKAIQYYMENISRNSIGVGGIDIPETNEISFWKMLSKMGISASDIQTNVVTFENTIALSNFINLNNNTGWAEIVCQIPNKCKKLTPVWKTITDIANIVQTSDTDTALYDNGNKEFLFSSEQKKVLDFDNFVFDEVTEGTFDFNCLLLFYKDADGVNKLHGINFIYPFENKVTYWDIETFTQKTNKLQSIGYQFIFNQKTCNNAASLIQIYEQQENSFYNQFGETLGKLNSFLELKMNQDII